MSDTTVVEPDTGAEVAGAVLAITEEVGRADGRGRTLVLATAVSVGAAALATALAMVGRHRHAAAAEATPAVRRPSPTSTINVNWGFALFGSNVMAERRRRGRGPFWRRR